MSYFILQNDPRHAVNGFILLKSDLDIENAFEITFTKSIIIAVFGVLL